MARKCVLCDKDVEYGGEIHHIIPNFFKDKLRLTMENLDMFRIPLCKEHHKQITDIWSQIYLDLFPKIQRIDNEDDILIKRIFRGDIEKINYVYLLQSGHELEHDEDSCKFCSRVEDGGWIRNIINNGVEEGKRHITRFKLASNLKRIGWSKDSIKKKVLEFNSHCKPPEQQSIVEYHLNYLFKRWEKDGF